MIKKVLMGVFFSITTVGLIIACSSDEATTNASSCTLDDLTVATSTENAYGCALRTRDTSSCESSRTAQGLSGYWLKFSCRVSLSVQGSDVLVEADGQPDHMSNYFETSNACYEALSIDGRTQNPGSIGEQNFAVTIPGTPSGGGGAMSLGVVGIAANGVAIFSNAAAPGDNIYDEVATFDKCEGHPAGTTYHYHIEPPTLTSNDSAFVGIMRDGNPIYGRVDDGGSLTTGLDANGGHTGTTPDSGGASVYHYHVNLQTDGSDSAYFITSGNYNNNAGSCSGCN